MPLWPIGVYFLAVLAIVAVMLAVPRLVGERHFERATGDPYEAGAPPTGPGRARVTSQFYLVAILFVIFDLEAVFLFAWAVAAREVGWLGYFEAVVFTGVLLAGLFYLWRVGALDWGTSAMLEQRRREHARQGRELEVASMVSKP